VIEIQGIDLSERLVPTDTGIDFILTGLQVGNYTITMTLPDTSERLGTTYQVDISVMATSSLNVIEEITSGIVGQEHSIEVNVIDSLGAEVPDVVLLVSIWDPDGREIYGNILSEVTLIEAIEGSVIIDWTPAKAGNYSILLKYEGTAFIGNTSLSLRYLTLYESNLEIIDLNNVTYPSVPRIMLTLTTGIAKIQRADITISLLLGNTTLGQYTVTTDVRGLGQCDLVDAVAGNITVIVEYSGSDIYTAVSVTTYILVYPIAEVSLTTPGLYVGENCTLHLAVELRKLLQDWSGTVWVLISSEDSEYEPVQFEMVIEPIDEWTLWFIPQVVGNYTITVSLSDIPILGVVERVYSFTAIQRQMSIEMDPGTTPVIGGGMILGVIGVLLRRKLNGTVDTISGEWDI
jgi:hypothetical protein